MAYHQAIAATTQAIRRYLEDACPRAEFPGVTFELAQSGTFRKLTLGISLYLYRVTVSGARRNLPPRRTSDGRKLRAPLPVDLSMMLTAWAEDSEVQQRLLGWAMRALEDMPVFPAAALNYMQPEGEVFRPEETIEILYEPITLGEYCQLWDALKLPPQASATYVVRMIPIESRLVVTEAELVQTRIFDYAKGPA